MRSVLALTALVLLGVHAPAVAQDSPVSATPPEANFEAVAGKWTGVAHRGRQRAGVAKPE